jgi:hypothetical protein
MTDNTEIGGIGTRGPESFLVWLYFASPETRDPGGLRLPAVKAFTE